MGPNIQAAVAATALAIGAGPQAGLDPKLNEAYGPGRVSDAFTVRSALVEQGAIPRLGNFAEGLTRVDATPSKDPTLSLFSTPLGTGSSLTALKMIGPMTALDHDGPLTPEISQRLHEMQYEAFKGNLTATTDKLEALSKDLLTSPEARKEMTTLIDAELNRLGALANGETRITAAEGFKELRELRRLISGVEKIDAVFATQKQDAEKLSDPLAKATVLEMLSSKEAKVRNEIVAKVSGKIADASDTLALLEHQAATAALTLGQQLISEQQAEARKLLGDNGNAAKASGSAR
jgi:hypothetical protein